MSLGRLEQVPLRHVWSHEATGFSRWLAEEGNLRLLSETIGLELELEGVEQNVGPFRADVICKAGGSSDHWVLIENQIERTDHSHLGQLITYAAGLHTATIVWIAQRFTDEHRAALDWLNEVTTEEVSFFGLEIELWRINDSVPAPRFNVVSKPNHWVKQGAQTRASVTSASGDFYRQYWQGFGEFLVSRGSSFTPKRSDNNWISFTAGKSNVGYAAVISRKHKHVRARVSLTGQEAKARYRALLAYRAALDALAPGLDWRERPEGVESYIEWTLPADPDDMVDWPRQHEWLLVNLEKLQSAFRAYVGELS
jgi:hypothetical protein